ncbi:FGGY family carbohydrate kinase [Mycolicibacterium brumae]|uniref:Xylulose kinase n=1 Tax=Mycolicibacterium brumae TaxID=85968 RepID=A0A2G5PBF9_9MYCO|nr:FGGY family carbohydrate kinase [Mycolicibacterium brumae]MCV7193078.1 hypothetical protein [Mycolicibacterium brumae]PIB75390.1 hypothetical protein CQY22_009635 [Mycolicibacterium brumae]RWA21998.1 hypothetical protein MBRU_13510 [Mycolicibacterium brumae DSM 44177]UWW07920.1 FGGY family carbohydrate kinase [Mycolicibacterium brumae]
MTGCFLGIDLGTSGLKAALLGTDGAVLAVATAEYGYESPHPGWAQIDPELWLRAARRAVGEVLDAAGPAEVLAIGVDGQMHGLVLVDADGEPVAPALLWPDNRASGLLERWRRVPDAQSLRELLNPLAAGMTGPMLDWVAREWPERYACARKMLCPKDWLRSRLIPGVFVSDPSDASATLLWNAVNDDWHHRLVGQLGLNHGLLPEVRPSAEVAGVLESGVTRDWGLPAGAPVTVGAGDVAATLEAVDSPAFELSIVLGSGAQALSWEPGGRPGAEPDRPVRFHTYRAADERRYAMAASLNGGLVLGHARTLLGMSWQQLFASPFLELAVDDPLFLPFLFGERVPTPISAGHCSWTGINSSTTPEILAAVAVEGVLFGIRRAVESLPDTGGGVQLVGGAGSNPRVRQLLADILDRPVTGRAIPNATAVGAALLAARMAGVEVTLPQDGAPAVAEPSGSADDRYRRFLAQTEQITAGA